MNRAFWFAAGAVSGVYALVKVKRTAEKFTPDGIGARVSAVKAGAQLFADEVSAGMHEREADLLAELRASAHPGEHRRIAGPAESTSDRSSTRAINEKA